MEREVGGGIRMGNTCKPMAVSFQCMTKFTTDKKRKKENKKKEWVKTDMYFTKENCQQIYGMYSISFTIGEIPMKSMMRYSYSCWKKENGKKR